MNLIGQQFLTLVREIAPNLASIAQPSGMRLPLSLMFLCGIAYWLKFQRGLSRACACLENWATSNGLELIELKPTWNAHKMPLGWAFCSKGYMIFRIKARDREGAIRTGWAKVGSWMGLLANRTKVIWDSDPAMNGPDWLQQWIVAPPDPHLEQTYQGPRCVACRHPIDPSAKLCPKCDWMQPASERS